MKNSIFALTLLISAAVFAKGTSAGQKKWASTPQTTPFSEFKYYKSAPDSKSKLQLFSKQEEQSFSLSKPLQGDETEICHGSSQPDSKGKAVAIACALTSVGAKSCADVKIQDCIKDKSVKPMK